MPSALRDRYLLENSLLDSYGMERGKLGDPRFLPEGATLPSARRMFEACSGAARSEDWAVGGCQDVHQTRYRLVF